MATNGISDIFTTVSVPKPEYENLVRDSEKIETLKRLIKSSKYVTTGEVMAILEIEESDKEESEETNNESV